MTPGWRCDKWKLVESTRGSPCANQDFERGWTRAGTPKTNESGETSLVTTEPAPVVARSPTLTGATSIVSAPILALLPMSVL